MAATYIVCEKCNSEGVAWLSSDVDAALETPLDSCSQLCACEEPSYVLKGRTKTAGDARLPFIPIPAVLKAEPCDEDTVWVSITVLGLGHGEEFNAEAWENDPVFHEQVLRGLYGDVLKAIDSWSHYDML